MEKNDSFENILNDIKNIVNELEKENITIDKSIELFEKGAKLALLAEEKLKNVKSRVIKVVKDSKLFDIKNEK